MVNRVRQIKKQLGDRYHYTRSFKEKYIEHIKNNIPPYFSDTTVASLVVGCLRLDAVRYKSGDTLRLGYDVYVKDDPESEEWICYDTLSENVSLKEADMMSTLDRLAEEHALSYTECCFARLNGKVIDDKKKHL